MVEKYLITDFVVPHEEFDNMKLLEIVNIHIHTIVCKIEYFDM